MNHQWPILENINTNLIKVQRLTLFHFIDFLNIMWRYVFQNVLTDRLSLAISPKFPEGDILGTTLVAEAWEIFVSWTVDKPKKFSK